MPVIVQNSLSNLIFFCFLFHALNYYKNLNFILILFSYSHLSFESDFLLEAGAPNLNCNRKMKSRSLTQDHSFKVLLYILLYQ
jgi:hypothetical protein